MPNRKDGVQWLLPWVEQQFRIQVVKCNKGKNMGKIIIFPLLHLSANSSKCVVGVTNTLE